MGQVRPKTSRAGTLAAAAATVLIAVGLIAWLAWPSTPAVPGASRVRQYTDARACLLTGSGGITTSQAANRLGRASRRFARDQGDGLLPAG